MVALNVLEMPRSIMVSVRIWRISQLAVLAAQKVTGVLGVAARLVAVMEERKAGHES